VSADATSALDRAPDGRVGYRVLVPDGAGHVVGGSDIVNP
jgi:hypothetical protein